MDNYKETILLISQANFSVNQKVQLIELLLNGLEIDTIQGIADITGKTYNGVKYSKKLPKIMIGRQKMAIKGATSNNFPF